jgi:hypothetical protein
MTTRSALRAALFAALLAAPVTPPARAADDAKAPPEPAGATPLFNGKDLSGWDGDPRLWSVTGGVIRGETTPEKVAKGNTFLVLKDRPVADFDLRFSFRCNATNNSGVMYRSKHIADGKDNKWVMQGYQHEIRNENKLPNVSGFIYDEKGRRGRICLAGEKAEWVDGKKKVTGTLIDAAGFAKLFKLDEWNEVVIVAKGSNIKHYLNGTLILDFTDAPDLTLKSGLIGLQLHAGKPMWAEFKDLRVADLK